MSDHTIGGEITRLVHRWQEGDEEALELLVSHAYDDLRAIAHRRLDGSDPQGTLRTTALVHEAYIRLVGVEDGTWASRGHFFAFCSKAMRHILIDYARARRTAKRGGDRERVPFPEDLGAIDADVDRVLAVEEALGVLEERDERLARMVECRFFGGLTTAETAETLGVTPRTVARDWVRAQAHLRRILADGDG